MSAASHRWSIPCRVDALGPLRIQARQVAEEHGFETDPADDFALCVHEAVSNAIVHGHGENSDLPVDVEIEPLPDGLKVTVRNQGPQFDVDAVLGRQPGDGPRGRGMNIIRSLTDEAVWADGGRLLTFVKRR